MVTLDGDSVDWTCHAKDDTENYALMAFNSNNAGSGTKVTSCSKVCEESYAKLKKLYDEQREQLGDASIEIQAHTLALKKMSAKDKSGLGYGNQIHEGVVSYENEILEIMFDSRSSDVEDSPVTDRFAKVKGMHVVPPPMTGIYMPPKSDFRIDESKFTYGPKQSKTSESDAKTSNIDSCESNSSEETLESVPKPVKSKPKAVSKPKVWSDAPIIEEYESDSDDEYVFKVSVEQEKPSCDFINIVKHVKTPRHTVKDQDTSDASLAKHKALALELEIKRLSKAVVSQDIMNIVQKESVVDTSDLQTELERTKERFENCIIKKETGYAKLWNYWYKKCDECKYDKISYDKAYKDMQQKIERLQAQLGDLKEFQVLNYARENAHLKATYKNLFDSIYVSRTQTKTIIASLQNELQSTTYKNAKLKTQLFKKVSEQKNNTHDTSENTKFAKQPIVENLPKVGETNALSKLVTSNSVSTPQESKGVNNDKVIAPGMFRINPFKTSREGKHVPNTVSVSARTKPITVSQPPVITKKDVNSDLNGLSSTGLDNTKTKIPQPRSNTKHDRVPSASKSSRSKNKEAEVEEHHRNLLLSKNNKHISSACNNIKIDSQDVISKVVCAMSVILGFGDLQWGNILITRVYFVKGLGHNLFSVGQFCDSDLE
nr:integrase, catalytic region, zinc finger, CCHC-type, peptidase aspartic, catalytic [Tanacetum cinerariifolium]